MTLSSWKDDHLPLYLWAIVVRTSLDQHQSIDLFRKQLNIIQKMNSTTNNDYYLDHRSLSKTTDDDFDKIMEPVLSTRTLLEPLSAVATIKCLPDAHHWKRHFPEEQLDLRALAIGAMRTLDHQSVESTDVRWLAVMSRMANGKMKFASALSDRVDEIIEYPYCKDVAATKASIRAMEMACRSLHLLDGAAESDSFPEQFWKEMLIGTRCIISKEAQREPVERAELSRETVSIYIEICDLFSRAQKNSHVDPRLEGAFGIALYAIAILVDSLNSRGATFAANKLMLRTCVEACINLKFLIKNDNLSLWTQYRNYSSGQLKLSYLKYKDSADVPDFIDISRIEELAQEDYWFEYQDINLGSWASKTLRDMAIEAGSKDLYDKYYNVLSVSAHAQWGAIRETNFCLCLNPLHRLHRVPRLPMQEADNIIVDMAKIVNTIVDDLSSIYPGVKRRLKAHKKR